MPSPAHRLHFESKRRLPRPAVVWGILLPTLALLFWESFRGPVTGEYKRLYLFAVATGTAATFWLLLHAVRTVTGVRSIDIGDDGVRVVDMHGRLHEAQWGEIIEISAPSDFTQGWLALTYDGQSIPLGLSRFSSSDARIAEAAIRRRLEPYPHVLWSEQDVSPP